MSSQGQKKKKQRKKQAKASSQASPSDNPLTSSAVVDAEIKTPSISLTSEQPSPLHVHLNTHAVARGTSYEFNEQSFPADDYEATENDRGVAMQEAKEREEKSKDEDDESALESLLPSLSVSSPKPPALSLSPPTSSTTQKPVVISATSSSSSLSSSVSSIRTFKILDFRKSCKINDLLSADQFAIVFSNFDGHTVAKFNRVCKKWAEFVSDPMVWRYVCLNTWKDPKLQKYTGNWRQLFIATPHVRYDGCYVLETKYWRPGGYTELGTRPTTMVCVSYFRYLRFLPGRKVSYALMNSLPELPMTRPLALTEKRLCHGSFKLANPGIKISVDLPHMTASFTLTFHSTKQNHHDCLVVEDFQGCGPHDLQPIKFPLPNSYFHFHPERMA